MNKSRLNQLVFCVNPGRSGSYFLSQVFALVPGVCSVHEPEHQFEAYADLKPHLWNLGSRPLSETVEERTRLKHWQIDDLASRYRAATYVETNPLFATLWHDVVLNDPRFENISVIVLRREPARVLKSLLDLGWYSDRDGDSWMLSAYSVNSLFEPPMPASEATPADLVIGHLVNVELLARRIKRLCDARGFRVVETRAGELFSDNVMVQELLQQFGIFLDERDLAGIGEAGRNKKAAMKKYGDTPLADCIERLDAYIARCERRVQNLFD